MELDREAKYRRYADKVRIFHGLKPKEVAEVLHRGHVVYFHEGQTVFHEGMLGSNLFVVLSGQVDIKSKNQLIATCHVGDAFGEMAALNRRPRTATAVAQTPSKLLTLDEGQLVESLEKELAVKVLLNIIHVLSERLELANMQIARSR